MFPVHSPCIVCVRMLLYIDVKFTKSIKTAPKLTSLPPVTITFVSFFSFLFFLLNNMPNNTSVKRTCIPRLYFFLCSLSLSLSLSLSSLQGCVHSVCCCAGGLPPPPGGAASSGAQGDHGVHHWGHWSSSRLQDAHRLWRLPPRLHWVG